MQNGRNFDARVFCKFHEAFYVDLLPIDKNMKDSCMILIEIDWDFDPEFIMPWFAGEIGGSASAPVVAIHCLIPDHRLCR